MNTSVIVIIFQQQIAIYQVEGMKGKFYQPNKIVYVHIIGMIIAIITIAITMIINIAVVIVITSIPYLHNDRMRIQLLDQVGTEGKGSSSMEVETGIVLIPSYIA